MAAGDMSDSVSHRQHGQPESEGNSEESDAQQCPGWREKGGGEHSGAAPPKNQPERAEEFGCGTARHVHGFSPASIRLVEYSESNSTVCNSLHKVAPCATDLSMTKHSATPPRRDSGRDRRRPGADSAA